MIELTHAPIAVELLLQHVSHPQAGAVVLFLGTTRQFTDGRETIALDYEAYDTMARQELQRLHDEACGRWSLTRCSIVHRLGRVAVGEASVAIAVSAAHRQEAFQAGQWLIDRLKESVPLWKCENWASGGTSWVHPVPPSNQLESDGRPDA